MPASSLANRLFLSATVWLDVVLANTREGLLCVD